MTLKVTHRLQGFSNALFLGLAAFLQDFNQQRAGAAPLH